MGLCIIDPHCFHLPLSKGIEHLVAVYSGFSDFIFFFLPRKTVNLPYGCFGLPNSLCAANKLAITTSLPPHGIRGCPVKRKGPAPGFQFDL